MPLCWPWLRLPGNVMKPKIYLLCTKHDWNAFIEVACGAICFRQGNMRSRVGLYLCLNRSKQVGGRQPEGSQRS